MGILVLMSQVRLLIVKLHVVDLTDSTIEANSRFFASRDQVPTKAISMGIASIMAAKKLSCLPMVTRRQMPFSRWSRVL